MNYLFLSFILLVCISFVSVYGSVENFSTDKLLYYDDDTIHVSGTVNYDPNIPFVIFQIITPDGTGLAGIGSVAPKSDGSVSAVFHVGGPTWSTSGDYTIKISYAGNSEKIITYQKLSDVSPSSSRDIESNLSNTFTVDESFIKNPKLWILGFPSLDNSPQYYIDRYNNEPKYKSWFDSQFPNYSIIDVVGYKSTHVEHFPSLDNSPQYYIDRYNNEPKYKSWFDSQFPDQTIYDVLGFSIPIPNWIQTDVERWARGDASDSEFVAVLDFMLENKILVIQNSPYSESDSISDIPNWVQNDALWWSDGLITQHEFLSSLKYLFEEKIIEIH